MGEWLRVLVGIMGNAASLLLYSAPMLTLRRVIRKKSTEEYSSVPYMIALLNCMVYTWYGLPVVSHVWDNFPVVTINSIGILLESFFLLVYFFFASSKSKIKVGATFVGVMIVFAVTVAVSTAVFHDHHHRKVFVGSVGLIASVSMYGSPLVVVKKVIETESVEYMPFYLSFFSFLASSLWMAYGLLSHDLFLAAPNLVGCPLGILQLVVYFKYKKKKGSSNENKWDVEQTNEEHNKTSHHLTTLQLVDVDGALSDDKANNLHN